MALNYGWEKLHSACRNAIGSTESVQKRLAGAITSDVRLLRRDDLPNDELWERRQKLIDASTCEPAKGDEGTIEATTSKMSEEDAAKWLVEMFDIFCAVAEEYRRLQGAAG